MKFAAVLVLLVAALAFARAEEAAEKEADAFLLVDKKVSSIEAVVNTNYTVDITVSNIGSSPAFAIEINDDRQASAKVLSGSRASKVEKLGAGETSTLSYTVTYAERGDVDVHPTAVSYANAPDSSERRTVYGNRVFEEDYEVANEFKGVVQVLSQSEFDKRHTKKMKEWSMFIFLTFILVGGPGVIYQLQKNRIDELVSKKPAQSETEKKKPTRSNSNSSK